VEPRKAVKMVSRAEAAFPPRGMVRIVPHRMLTVEARVMVAVLPMGEAGPQGMVPGRGSSLLHPSPREPARQARCARP
jgi:hypothetical protein